MSLKKNEVIIGRKELAVYIASVLYAFESNAEIKVSAIGSNINKLDRIVRLFSAHHVQEIGRSTKQKGKISILTCTLKRV